MNFKTTDITKYTNDQIEALEKIEEFLHNDEKQLLLSGAAGTGKSFLITSFLHDHPVIQAAFISPTHKARKVLDDMLLKHGLNVRADTIHSFLSLKPQRNYDTGKLEFVESKETLRGDYSYDLVLADEASMYRANECELLLKHCSKVLWIGDRYQLPPVDDDDREIAYPFQSCPNSIDLEEIVRYDGEILSYCTDLRNYIRDGWNDLLVTNVDRGKNVVPTHIREWRREAMKCFASEEYRHSSDYCKIIAFRNDTVITHNERVRDCLFGREAIQLYLPGETLIVKEPVVRRINSKESVVLQTSQEVTVQDYDISFEDGYYWYFLDVITDDGSEITLRVIHEEESLNWNNELARLKHEAKNETNRQRRRQKWEIHDDFNNGNDKVRHCYAITANSAQGSSYSNVFVDSYDISNCYNKKEMVKRLYVSASRAQEMLYLLEY